MGLRTTLRRIAASGGQVALLAVLAMVATMVLVGTPRVANLYTDAALAQRIETLGYQVRDVTFGTVVDPKLAVDPRRELRPTQVGRQLPALYETLGSELHPLVNQRWYAMQVGPVGLAAHGDGLPVNGFAQPAIGLRSQSGLTDAAKLVEGRWPAPALNLLRPVEAAVSVGVAKGLNLSAGSTFEVTPTHAPPGSGIDVVVVGIFTPLDPKAPIWDPEPEALHPFEPIGQDNVPWRGVVAVHESTIGIALNKDFAVSYEWRFRIDSRRLDASRVDEIATAVAAARRQQAVPGANAQTGLDAALERFADEVAAVQAILAIVQSGVLATLFGLVLLAALAIVDRRHAELVLLRARGGTSVGIAMRLLAESIVVIPLAAIAGWVIALLVPGRPGAADWLAVVFGLGALAAVPVLAGRRRAVGTAGREDVVLRRPSARRVTAELGLVGIAVLGVYLLRARGFRPQVGVDPYLVSVPVLLAAAAALIGLRILPWVLRRLSRIAARARGAVPFVGLAGAARAAPANVGPLAVMVVAISTGVFSAVVVSTVEDGRTRAASLAVPADAVVRGFMFPADTRDRLAATPGVSAVAAMSVNPAATLLGETGRDGGQVMIVVVDGPALARVIEVSAARVDLPMPVLDPGGRDQAPAIVSPSVGKKVGETGVALIQGQAYPFRIVDVQETFPSLPADTRQFMVLPAQALDQTARPILPNGFLIAGDVDASALARVGDEAQREWLGSVRGTAVVEPVLPTTVMTRAEYRSRLEGTGVNQVLSFTFAAGAASATVLVLLSVGFAVVAGARGRGHVMSRLRTMGLSRRQGRRLFLYELAPVIATGALAGAAVGAALPTLAAPVLALSTFTGGVPAPARLDPIIVAAVAILVLASVLAALAVESLAGRRMRLGEVLRLGEENR